MTQCDYHDMLPLEETSVNKGALLRLHSIGVHTVGDLRKVGAVYCYHKMKELNGGKTLPKCYNYYDLEAVLMNKKGGWKALSHQEKKRLDTKLLES